MNLKDMKTRLRVIASAVLIAGLGCSLFIYKTAADYSDNAGYVVIGGEVYPVNPGDSKIYRHGLELYGGKANVIADEFTRWFSGLWHGRRFASTLAVIAVFISLVLFFAAGRIKAGSSFEEKVSPK